MKVLLTHLPLLPGNEITPPLGLCTLASWLLHRGHDVQIVDLDLGANAGSDSPRQQVVAHFDSALRQCGPEVVADTSMYSSSLQAEHLVRLAKQYNPAVTTVAGGSHFGALGMQSLRRIPALDYVIEGEGELAFASLLDALE